MSLATWTYGRPDEESILNARLTNNRRRAVAVAVAFGVVVFVVFALVFALLQAGWLALALALVVAVVWTALAWRNATDIVLDLSDAEAADPAKDARLFNLTSALCAAIGVAPPSVYVVEDPARNALAAANNVRRGALVVTRGLVDDLSLVELEAVIALQLYRIRTGDVVPETVAVATIGTPGVLSEAADRWEWLRRALGVATPATARILGWLHPAGRDLEVDVAALEFTRFPPALATALEKMHGHSLLAVGTPVTAHLWAAPPVSTTAQPAVARFHAAIPERIALLQEL